MGAVKKFNKTSELNQLKHVTRQIEYPKNRDIDQNRTHLNYSLTPKRNITPFEYLKKRLSEIYVFNKKDINVMSGWIITMPKDLDESYEKAFFKATYDFLSSRYGGEKNVVSAEVHKDESGEPHMHFCFVPVTKNNPNKNMIKVIRYLQENPEENNTKVAKKLGIDRKTVRRYRKKTFEDIKMEKLSARSVINKKDLQSFHSDFQSYLDNLGIPAKIKTGVTKTQGGNLTVDQLKMQREYLIRRGDGLWDAIGNIDKTLEKEEIEIFLEK